MKKRLLFSGIHVLFCALLIYWFYNNSFIRPYAVFHPYKEIICALLVLLLIYLNYFILIPYLIQKHFYKNYVFLSLLLIGTLAIAELLIVKADILKCIGYNVSFNINSYMFRILFVIFLRDMGFYLFFTVLRLYIQTKANALSEKQMVLKDAGLILLPQLRGVPISININFVSYFSQNKNHTIIHNTIGKPISIYSSLNYIQNYLNDYCLRINKNNITTFKNIVSYNEEKVVVKESKNNVNKILIFSKKDVKFILNILRKKIPELEEKNDMYQEKTQNGNINNDKKTEIGNEKIEILEKIKYNPGINAIQLSKKFFNKISLRTIRRRLKELVNSGFIEFRGSTKKGGYYIV